MIVVPSTPVSVMPVDRRMRIVSAEYRVPSAPVNVMPSAPVKVMPSAPVKVMPSAPVKVMPSAPVSVIPFGPVYVVPFVPTGRTASRPLAEPRPLLSKLFRL